MGDPLVAAIVLTTFFVFIALGIFGSLTDRELLMYLGFVPVIVAATALVVIGIVSLWLAAAGVIPPLKQ